MPEAISSMTRVRRTPQSDLAMQALMNPLAVTRELNNRSLYHFLQHFWPIVSGQDFSHNWHIEYLCKELEAMAVRVALRQPREYDLVINVPPGSTKTITCSIMFPAWCWTKWHWMRFITASYSKDLSLESAEYCRDLIRSALFQEVYPEIDIKEDKDTKSNFKVVKYSPSTPGHEKKAVIGGSRFSTSVGGTLTGFHGDILIVDDPLNPEQSFSDVELNKTNRWCSQTLTSRKTNKAVSPIIYIMQRLHQNDPSGYILAKNKTNIRHICLPGEIRNYGAFAKPEEVKQFYINDLLDPKRMPWSVLDDMLSDLGPYGFAGQIGQNPTPPGGAMFKVNNFEIVDEIPNPGQILRAVRYWDKAASKDMGAYTVGCLMLQLLNNRWLVTDVRRGRWSSERREQVIKDTAQLDGSGTTVWLEQEPGSGGKESAEASIRNLAGFSVYAERPTGDKITRAESYSVQVNNGGVRLLKAPWNHDFIEEHRFFPASTYKDQVDAAAGAFHKLIFKRIAKRVT